MSPWSNTVFAMSQWIEDKVGVEEQLVNILQNPLAFDKLLRNVY